MDKIGTSKDLERKSKDPVEEIEGMWYLILEDERWHAVN